MERCFWILWIDSVGGQFFGYATSAVASVRTVFFMQMLSLAAMGANIKED